MTCDVALKPELESTLSFETEIFGRYQSALNLMDIRRDSCIDAIRATWRHRLNVGGKLLVLAMTAPVLVLSVLETLFGHGSVLYTGVRNGD